MARPGVRAGDHHLGENPPAAIPYKIVEVRVVAFKDAPPIAKDKDAQRSLNATTAAVIWRRVQTRTDLIHYRNIARQIKVSETAIFSALFTRCFHAVNSRALRNMRERFSVRRSHCRISWV